MLLSWNNLYIRISYEFHTSSISVLASRRESKKKERKQEMARTRGIRIENDLPVLKTLVLAQMMKQMEERENEKGHCHYKVGRRCRVGRIDRRRM